MQSRDSAGGSIARRISIRTRLAAAFGALILLLAAMAGVGAWRLQELERNTTDMATENLRVERAVGEWLAETRLNLQRRLVVTRSDDPALAKMFAPELEAGTKRINEVQEEVNKLVKDGEAAAMVKDIEAKRTTFLATRAAVAEKKKAGDSEGAIALLDASMMPAQNAYIDAMQALRDYYTKEVERDAAAAAENAASGRRMLGGFCIAGVLLALIASWLIARSITRPIDEAVRAARRIADGDLSVEVSIAGSDEMSQLLRAQADMAGSLRRLVGEVAQGARTVAETSAQIAQGNVDLSQRTEEQASTLEETASSMEELTTTVGQNADHARQASQLASDASRVALEGGEVVGQVVRTMTGISESSRQIAEIIGVIDGIAFQTNILALNAAVEAARAGEQGRGFAVVATEVRNLAQRSAGAAKEIKGLISESVQQVEAGSRQVDAAGRKMDDVVLAAQKVNQLIAEIAGASQEQRSGIEQVNAAVTAMDQGIQQNASLVEEAAAATESMKGQAAALHASVARFRLQDAAGGQSLPGEEQPPAVTATIAGVRMRESDAANGVMLTPAPPRWASAGEWRVF